MADYELVVADAMLRGRPGRYNIGIAGGKVAAIEAGSLRGDTEIDAAGNLVTSHSSTPICTCARSTP